MRTITATQTTTQPATTPRYRRALASGIFALTLSALTFGALTIGTTSTASADPILRPEVRVDLRVGPPMPLRFVPVDWRFGRRARFEERHEWMRHQLECEEREHHREFRREERHFQREGDRGREEHHDGNRQPGRIR